MKVFCKITQVSLTKLIILGELYVNGGLESKFTPFFPPINKVGTAMRNNMEAKMIVNNLQVCQGTRCSIYVYETSIFYFRDIQQFFSDRSFTDIEFSFFSLIPSSLVVNDHLRNQLRVSRRRWQDGSDQTSG